jgi:hypothetical protein
MAYGLGAQAEPVVGGLNFYQARQHVLAVEQRFSQRGQQLIQKFQAQAKQRETQGESRTVEQKLPAIVPER